MNSKFPQLVELLHRRLRSGEYALDRLPSERDLAQSFGVSHMTARRATQQMISEGLLARDAGGRLQPGVDLLATRKRLQIAFVLPAFVSPSLQRWYFALSKVVEKHNGILKPVGYSSFHDPIITDALDGPYDGLFIIPPTDFPPLLLKRLKREAHRVVTIAHDLTDLGIPCVNSGSARFVGRLVEHLRQLGHERIDCLNTQPLSTPIDQRIAEWKAAIDAAGLSGTLHNAPVEAFHSPETRALELGRKLFAAPLAATALITITSAAALGLYRAAYEAGIRIGRDLSVCTCDSDEEEANLFTPSLTTLANEDPRVCLEIGFDWIARRGENWDRPMSIAPGDVPIWHGESTGPIWHGDPTGPTPVARPAGAGLQPADGRGE